MNISKLIDLISNFDLTQTGTLYTYLAFGFVCVVIMVKGSVWIESLKKD